MAGVKYSSTFTFHNGRVTAAIAVGSVRGLNRAAERLRSLSVPLAPLDQGPLRASAAVREATLGGAVGLASTQEAIVLYDTPYAVRQHEETGYRHTEGQAKYLEEPLHAHRAELQAIIAQEVKVAILRA